MKRTTVFADENDLTAIKVAAARLGIAEAEILREAIHLAAMAHRTWSEPFFTYTYGSSEGGSPRVRADEVLESVWTEKAEAYERTKSPPP